MQINTQLILLLVFAVALWQMSSNQELGKQFDMFKRWVGFGVANDAPSAANSRSGGLSPNQALGPVPITDNKEAGVEDTKVLEHGSRILQPGRDVDILKEMKIPTYEDPAGYSERYVQALAQQSAMRAPPLAPVPIKGGDLLRTMIPRTDPTAMESSAIMDGNFVPRNKYATDWAEGNDSTL